MYLDILREKEVPWLVEDTCLRFEKRDKFCCFEFSTEHERFKTWENYVQLALPYKRKVGDTIYT